MATNGATNGHDKGTGIKVVIVGAGAYIRIITN